MAVELKSPEMGKMASATREYLVCNVEYRLRKRGGRTVSCKEQKRIIRISVIDS